MTPFDPQDPSTWAAHLRHLEERTPPQPGAPLETYQDWNLGIGPLVTDDTRKIEHAIAQAQLRYIDIPFHITCKEDAQTYRKEWATRLKELGE